MGWLGLFTYFFWLYIYILENILLFLSYNNYPVKIVKYNGEIVWKSEISVLPDSSRNCNSSGTTINPDILVARHPRSGSGTDFRGYAAIVFAWEDDFLEAETITLKIYLSARVGNNMGLEIYLVDDDGSLAWPSYTNSGYAVSTNKIWSDTNTAIGELSIDVTEAVKAKSSAKYLRFYINSYNRTELQGTGSNSTYIPELFVKF